MFEGIKSHFFDDPDFKEDSVRELIIAPILKRLGYLPTGETRITRSKKLKHPFIRVGTKNHPVTTIPDYTIIHNEKAILVLDAKGPKENILKIDHIQQAYSYAIHPEIKCREFALCNGRQLAIFNIDSNNPLLLLDFTNFESSWIDIEKHLALKYLLNPVLRQFRSDFGHALKMLGLTKNNTIHLSNVRLDTFGKISNDFYTASTNCDFSDTTHCASFDFPSSMLGEIVSGIPKPLADMFCDAINRAPFYASAGLVIEIDLIAKMGDENIGGGNGMNEAFVPLIIQEVTASRFNPDPVENPPNDIPEHVFQLRKAFKIRNADT